MISPTASRPILGDRSKFPNFFRTILPDSAFGLGWFSLCIMLGIKRVTPISQTDTWASSLAALVRDANSFGIKLMGSDLSENVPGLRGVEVNVHSWLTALNAMKELK